MIACWMIDIYSVIRRTGSEAKNMPISKNSANESEGFILK